MDTHIAEDVAEAMNQAIGGDSGPSVNPKGNPGTVTKPPIRKKKKKVTGPNINNNQDDTANPGGGNPKGKPVTGPNINNSPGSSANPPG